MPRSSPGHRRRDDDDEDDDEGEEVEEEDDEDEEETPPPRRPRHEPARRSRRHRRPPPVRRWRSSQDEDELEEESEEEVGPPGSAPWQKKPIYWRARDSLFFEPLVALAIIVVLLVSLFAYTQNWPPVYVVESQSMQHGSSDQLGLINAGDLVLAQKVPTSSITPYVTGLQTGYSTYGEYGDVLLYWPNGQGPTPIIHRAILYLQWGTSAAHPSGYYNATDLLGLPCGTPATAVYSTPGTPASAGTPANCGVTDLTGSLNLYRIGWTSLNITLTLAAPALGDHSGFVTLGDNNTEVDQAGLVTAANSALVEPGWIIGVARGMIPWFGAVKLLLEGESSRVPTQSWEYLGLTLVSVILVAFGVHYALRTEGIETPLRRREEEAARAEGEAEPAEPSLSHRIWTRLRHRRPEDEEEEEAEEPRQRRTRPPPSHPPSPRRGRPAPRVRRAERSRKPRDSDDEL